MYMNCVRIMIKSIVGSFLKNKVGKVDVDIIGSWLLGMSIISCVFVVLFFSWLNMFVVNVNNGCSIVEMFDVVFLDFGLNV